MSGDAGAPQRGRRRLTDEERALWRGVTGEIKPLRRRPAKPVESDKTPAAIPSPPVPTKPARGEARPAGRPASQPQPPSPPPRLERRLAQRLKRGSAAIDARLDLHGMTQARAHGALLAFLRQAQARGDRVVLVITGKGAAEAEAGRGVLRRQVPQWLEASDCRGLVLGYQSAGPGHGGEGALYLRLRKAR